MIYDSDTSAAPRPERDIIADALYIASIWLRGREDAFPGMEMEMLALLHRKFPDRYAVQRLGVEMWMTAAAMGYQPGPGGVDARSVYEFLVANEVEVPIVDDADEKVVAFDAVRRRRRSPPASGFLGGDAA